MSVGESKDGARISNLTRFGQLDQSGQIEQKWPFRGRDPEIGQIEQKVAILGSKKGTPKRSHFTNFSELFKLFADDMRPFRGRDPESAILDQNWPISGSGQGGQGEPNLEIWSFSRSGQDQKGLQKWFEKWSEKRAILGLKSDVK